MDSGLGSDEDRRSRTKEQKQLRNQQLLSGCFIDAASLSDDAEVAVDQRRTDERRQGALIFQSSIPQFSMLQMAGNEATEAATVPFPETSTPYNSIVHLEEEATRKSPLGFYVDLNEMPEPPKTPPATAAKKNIFSMVIDFEGPKKDKPTKLSSSLVSYRKNKQSKQLTLTSRHNGNSSLSSSVSSISSVAGPSRQLEDHEKEENEGNRLSASSKSSSSSENFPVQKSEDEAGSHEAVVDKGKEKGGNEKKSDESEVKNEEIKENETQVSRQPIFFFFLKEMDCITFVCLTIMLARLFRRTTMLTMHL